MKIFMWITAIIFIVTFVGGTVLSYFTGMMGGPSRNIVTINGEEVPREEFRDLHDRLREQRQENQNAPLTTEGRKQLRREAFTQLVNQRLMQQFVGREGGKATESEIRRAFMQQMSRNKKGKVSRRRIARFLQRMRKERRKKLEKSQRQQIENIRMTRWLENHVETTDTEAQILLEAGLNEVNLFGLYLNPERYVDEKRVRKYYEGNKQNYSRAPRAYVRHILMKPDTGSRQTPGTLSSIKDTIETIRRRFRAGDDVTELAREYSEDTATARKGGLMGWVTPDEVSQPLSREIFGSSDTQTLSNLVRTDRGYHLVYVEKGPVLDHKPLSEVESQIRSKLLSDTHWIQARQDIQSYRETISEAESSFDRLKQIALTKSHSDFASSQNGHYGWVPIYFLLDDQYPYAQDLEGELSRDNIVLSKISDKLISLDKNNISEPVEHDFGFHIFYLRDRRQPNLEDLSDTQTVTVKRRIAFEKQNAYTKKWLERKRKEATIELQIPADRVGGQIDWVDS